MRHPLHPTLVHFPVACWSLAVFADFASLAVGRTAWQWSPGLLTVGCIMALAAMLAGLLEITHIPDSKAMRDTIVHMIAMIVALVLFSARLLMGPYGLQPIAPGTLGLVLDAGGFIALAVGGWFGGRLAHGHGVGRA